MEATKVKPEQAGIKTVLDKIHLIGPILEESLLEEESNRRLSEDVIGALRENGLHRLFLPKSLGGLEADPLTVAKLVEEIARYNTAAGWSMMVANVSAWWCGRLPDQGIEEIYQEGPHTLIAGAFHPPTFRRGTKAVASNERANSKSARAPINTGYPCV
jgi:alkylation response protein AidB-like acyl-CoA dehydrogenase